MKTFAGSGMDVPQKTGRVVGDEILRSLLQQIPTLLGRLIYLAGLRNPESGRYEQDTVRRALGPNDTDALLRNGHRKAFSEWLSSSLEDQKNDLDGYLAGLEHSNREIGRELARIADFRAFVPPSAREIEMQLYVSDWEILLALLKSGPQGFGNPGA